MGSKKVVVEHHGHKALLYPYPCIQTPPAQQHLRRNTARNTVDALQLARLWCGGVVLAAACCGEPEAGVRPCWSSLQLVPRCA